MMFKFCICQTFLRFVYFFFNIYGSKILFSGFSAFNAKTSLNINKFASPRFLEANLRGVEIGKCAIHKEPFFFCNKVLLGVMTIKTPRWIVCWIRLLLDMLYLYSIFVSSGYLISPAPPSSGRYSCIALPEEALGRRLVNYRNKTGPRSLPCGTLTFIRS